MSVLKRGPGRPPKVRPQASVPTTIKADEEPVIQPKPDPVRVIEVELVRKYVPEGQDTEVKATVPPGTVMLVSEDEATRLLKLGGAIATENTFNR